MRGSFLALLLVLAVCPLAVAADSAPQMPVKRWKVEDFDPLLFVGLEGYRDFENGRRVFSGASCAACHRFAGVGTAKASDLEKAVERMGPRELLEAILSEAACRVKIDAFDEEDVLDLLAYLLSGGNGDHAMFAK